METTSDSLEVFLGELSRLIPCSDAQVVSWESENLECPPQDGCEIQQACDSGDPGFLGQF